MLLTQFAFQSGPGESHYLAGWDGYPAARRRSPVVATELVGTAISSDPAFTSKSAA